MNEQRRSPHGGRPLLVVILVSLGYPVVYYAVIIGLAITAPAARYSLTIASAVFLTAVALWATKKDGIALEAIGWSLIGSNKR